MLRVLNLGCGTKISPHPSVINMDWSILFRIYSSPILRLLAPVLLNGYRLRRFNSLSGKIIAHDLSNGIPFDKSSVDVVYHSHVLEHLDREKARDFIDECARVLRPGGIIRVVVPDFERYCSDYIDHVILCEKGNVEDIGVHDKYLEPILLQSVIREADGTSRQSPIRRFIENLLLGDARARGHTHQWMYDRFNLFDLLKSSGFTNIVLRKYNSSYIDNWDLFGLDENESGYEYKPESLYMEAKKPLN